MNAGMIHLVERHGPQETEKTEYAGVAELADAQASGACGRKIVWVQVPSPARFKNLSYQVLRFFFILQ